MPHPIKWKITSFDSYFTNLLNNWITFRNPTLYWLQHHLKKYKCKRFIWKKVRSVNSKSTHCEFACLRVLCFNEFKLNSKFSIVGLTIKLKIKLDHDNIRNKWFLMDLALPFVFYTKSNLTGPITEVAWSNLRVFYMYARSLTNKTLISKLCGSNSV